MRRLLEQFGNKGDLMAGVLRRLGASGTVVEHDPLGFGFQRMVSRCLSCKAGAECRTWLNDGRPIEELEGFCANAAAFKGDRAH